MVEHITIGHILFYSRIVCGIMFQGKLLLSFLEVLFWNTHGSLPRLVCVLIPSPVREGSTFFCNQRDSIILN